MKHCAALTPSFKVRILIPLPRVKQVPLGACFLFLRRSKDSQNRYYEQSEQQGYWAPIQNLRFCKWVRFLLRAKRVTRLLGTHSKSTILQMGNVLIPLPIRAETAEFKLFLLFFCLSITQKSGRNYSDFYHKNPFENGIRNFELDLFLFFTLLSPFPICKRNC